MKTTRQELKDYFEAKRGRHYFYQPETIAELRKVPRASVASTSATLGVQELEPLLVAMDSAIRYAKAYKARFEQDLVDEPMLGPAFEWWIKSIRALLNGDGAVAMERGLTTDSKDNGVIESLYWKAREIGGWKGEG